MFDPNEFLGQTFTEALDTKIVPCPAGEYTAVASKVEIRQWASPNKGTSGLKLVILWEIDDNNVREFLGRDTVRVPQEQLLDLTESGGLDTSKGKNVGLGRIREALDLNKSGKPFSFGMIEGRMARVNVSHRTDGEDVYAEVKKIAKAG